MYKEALHYEFKLQGYGNVTNAIKGLLKTNIDDILGFAYVNTRLPQNTEPLENFMYLCGMLSESYDLPKKFLFALQETDGLEDLFNQDYGNLDFAYLPDVEAITDLEINRGIFGSILKHNYNPYKTITVGIHDKNKLKNVEDGTMTKADLVKLLDDFPRLEFTHVVNPYLLRVFDDYHVLDSLKRTVEEDLAYQDYLEFNPLFAKMRRAFLSLKFLESSLNLRRTLAKPSDTQLELYKNLVDTLAKKLEELGNGLQDLNSSDYSLVKGILYLLQQELLNVHDLIYNERR